MIDDKPFVLSEQGSDRATAYASANKSVTLGDRTHIVWTDAVAITRGRTFDHKTQQWGETVNLGEGTDNHNSPSLTADASGHLHVAFGPHGTWQRYEDNHPRGCFKYLVSPNPSSFEGMAENLNAFGYHATYPSLMCTPRGHCVVYRGGEVPYGTMFQRTTPEGGWSAASELMRMDIKPQYTHWGSIVAADTQGAIYVAGHFYEITSKQSGGVCVLRSDDLGDTWTSLAGERATLPIRYHDRFVVPHAAAKYDPRIEGLCVDPQGKLWALCSSTAHEDRSLLLSCWDGGWKTIDLAQFVPSELMTAAGGLCITQSGAIHVVCTVGPSKSIATSDREQSKWWGHPTLEVAHLVSTDAGATFTFNLLSDGDESTPNWLPTISRPGPFHPVDYPIVLWTKGFTGSPSARCRPDTQTTVIGQRV